MRNDAIDCILWLWAVIMYKILKLLLYFVTNIMWMIKALLILYKFRYKLKFLSFVAIVWQNGFIDFCPMA